MQIIMDKEALAKAAGAALASGALGRISDEVDKKTLCLRSSNHLGRILFCRYFHFLFTVI